VNAATLDADDREIRDALVELDDLAGHPGERPLDGPVIQEQLPLRFCHPMSGEVCGMAGRREG
jgi:hypothetical protein